MSQDRILALALGAGLFILGLVLGTSLSAMGAAPQGNAAVDRVVAYDKWTVRCSRERPQPDAEAAPSADCRLEQVMLARDTGQQVASLAIIPSGDFTSRSIELVVPLGILLQPGVVFAIGDTASQTLAIERCLAAGCIVRAALDAPMMVELAKGGEARLTVTRPDSQTFTIPVDIGGYNAAIDTAKRERAKLEGFWSRFFAAWS